MENEIKLNPQELQIQGLLARYLVTRERTQQPATAHIDEDSLNAFVEGTLHKRESETIVTHLVDCGLCRHATAELIRLEFAFAEEAAPVRPVSNAQPAKISEVLGGIFSRLFGSNDAAVFAHEDPEKKEKDPDDDAEVEKK